MPVLMEKKDWMQTVANVSAAESVWYENISSDSDTVYLPLPGSGSYQVILVKIDKKPSATSCHRRSARELIGYGRKFDPVYRSTAEVMKELREGEED